MLEREEVVDVWRLPLVVRFVRLFTTSQTAVCQELALPTPCTNYGYEKEPRKSKTVGNRLT